MQSKLKNITLIFLLTAILVLFSFAIRSSNAPPNLTPDLHKARSSGESAINKDKEDFWQKATSDPVAIFTLVLTAFTGILAFATCYLWRATEQLVTGAEIASERQLRAYVTLDRIDTRKVKTDDGQIASISFQPIFINSGQTIARKVAYYTTTDHFFTGGVPDAKFSTMPEKSVISTIIGPSQTEVGPATDEIKAVDFIELIRHRVVVLVYGAINYTDVFEKPRRTEFSAFFNAGNYSDGSRDIIFTKTAEHNNADEDCMREPYATAMSPLRNPLRA